MIRFRVKELMAEKEFKEGRRITIAEVAEACGINRMTLSKIAGQRGYSTVTDNLDRLCRYFSCEIGELVVYIPEDVTTEDSSES
ncbi:helix-turn-helix domain-containing protein [Vogesella sp. GCM10023246]|uniref:Helix-turn-helix transcriptional regulator n=2 Tax=Chromobacteriaceae TaxID=1499392 RepID=A0ABV1M714_9NEIS